jgi:CRP/FNR family transcriptional regulator
MAACGQSSFRLRLTMSRRDIASHIGVAHETVSRAFGELADWGYLRVDHREVEILDSAALKSLAGSTRGLLGGRLRGLGRSAASRGNAASSQRPAI